MVGSSLQHEGLTPPDLRQLAWPFVDQGLGIFTWAHALLPAFLLWLLVVAEFYRKVSDRAEAIAVGAGLGFVAGGVWLVALTR